jgi:hypothetical protein
MMIDFDKLSRTSFFKSGAVRFKRNAPRISYPYTIAVYDTTLYKTAAPKKCYIHDEASYRPHLVRHLNFLQTPEEVEMRNFIQALWEKANAYVDSLGHEVYQSFLVINSPGIVVPPHVHLENFDGDTITLQMSAGNDTTSKVDFCTKDARTTYPLPDGKLHGLCFDASQSHWTEGTDNNYHIHFVYDVYKRLNGLPRVEWFKI